MFLFGGGSCGYGPVYEWREKNGAVCVPIRDMSSFQRVVCTGLREVSLFWRVVCTGFNGVGT